MEKIIAFRWVMNEDGSGVLFSFVDRRSVLIQTENSFDSLIDLPGWVSEAIRDDGRERGEWISGDSRYRA